MRKVIIRVQDVGEVRVISLMTSLLGNGVQLTNNNIDSFLRRIKAEYDRNSRKIIVDLTEVKLVDVHAVNELLINNNKWSGLVLCFCSPKEEVRTFLEQTNFCKVFAVYNTTEEAFKSFKK